MSITDELREFMAGADGYELWCPRHKNELTVIADRIDAEHEAACAEAYGDGVMSVPIALDESQWVKLPVDADGVPIHIGDELDVGFVARIVITDDEWSPYLYAYKETPNILTQHFCNEVSHHHGPTVEDVLYERLRQDNDGLRELVRALLTCATDGECDECRMNGATPWHVGEAQLCDGVWEHLRELEIEVNG